MREKILYSVRYAYGYFAGVYFFRHEISKLRSPIAAKLSHMTECVFDFIILVQNFGFAPVVYFQPMKKFQNFLSELSLTIARMRANMRVLLVCLSVNQPVCLDELLTQ